MHDMECRLLQLESPCILALRAEVYAELILDLAQRKWPLASCE